VTLPLVISLPHCSGRVPARIRPTLALDDRGIRDSVDIGTTEIFGRLPAASVLSAEWSRLVADLNRDPNQRDAKGIVPVLDYDGRSVYLPGMYPNEKEVAKRLDRYYFPFHRRLTDMLDQPGMKGLLDIHSMNAIGPAQAPDAGMRRMDIALGNNGGTRGEASPALGRPTCPETILFLMKTSLEGEGFSVSLNSPYSGGFITAHYGRTLMQGERFAVQIEINQALCVDADNTTLRPERAAAVGERMERALEVFVGRLGECSTA
jgi:N-formylglutamate deformylase